MIYLEQQEYLGTQWPQQPKKNHNRVFTKKLDNYNKILVAKKSTAEEKDKP